MTDSPLKSIQRLDPSWPAELPDLRAHPQFAVLASLHSAALLATHALIAAHPPGPRLDDESAAVLSSLLHTLDDLLVALDRYRGRLHEHIDPSSQGTPPRVAIPPEWTPEQADAVFAFLHHLGDAVWTAHEADLVQIAIEECEREPQSDS